MSPQDSPDLAALLAAMRARPSVPDGWDAVLSLSQSAVQSVVRRNLAGALQTNKGRSLLWVAPAQANGQHDVVALNTDLSPPSVSLSVADQAVHVSFRIDGGTQQVGKAPAALVSRAADTRAVAESGGVSWSEPVAITQQRPLQLAGSLPVGVAAAADQRGFSIGLSPADGRLTLSGHDAAGLSSPAVSQSLGNWLAAQKVSGVIGSVAPRSAGGATVLTPASVTARVAPSLGGQPVLQILTGASPGAPAPAAGAPVPHPDPHDFSLIVNSKATMTLIANGYNLGMGDIKLVSVPPQDGELHWFAQTREPMVFEGVFGNQDGKIYVTDRSTLFMRFGGSTDQGLKLFTFIDPNSTVRLQLELAAHYPTGVSGAGTDQVVGLREGAQSVTGNGFYEAIVQPQLQKFLTGDIKSDMSKVRLPAVSDLLLRDLNVPGYGLQFDLTALPAELLVAGRLVPNA